MTEILSGNTMFVLKTPLQSAEDVMFPVSGTVATTSSVISQVLVEQVDQVDWMRALRFGMIAFAIVVSVVAVVFFMIFRV